MAKKVDIRTITLKERLDGLFHLPHTSIVKAIDKGEFSLAGNSILSYQKEKLSSEEYFRCLSLLETRAPYAFETRNTKRAVVITTMRLQPVMDTISLKEMDHQDELKNIAVETIRDMFDIPEYIKILPEFSLGMEEMEEQDPGLPLDEEVMLEMQDEIQKRIILNALVHGSAMHIWKSAYYIVAEKIDAMDNILMDLYNDYTAAISWLIWQMPVGTPMEVAQGSCQLDLKDESITCSGINFPVLLHEVTKGAMDYLISRGIPEHYSEEQLKYYYAQADNYNDEVWHYLLSPTVWTRFIEAANVETQELPGLIAQLSTMDYQDLTDVLKACIDDPEAGRTKLNELNNV